MSDRQCLLKFFRVIGLMFAVGFGMSACAAGGSMNWGASWKEEVLLHDGQKLIVERSQTRGGRHEIGQEIPIAEHKISFTLPGTHEEIIWKTKFGMDINDTSLILLALDVINGVPYIATNPAGCIAYNKWDRPNPPYAFFKYDGSKWQRIPMEEFPAEIKEANVVIGIQVHEHQLKMHSGPVTANEVKEINEESRNPNVLYLRMFTRTPIKNETTVGCPDYSSPRYTSPKAPHPIVTPSATGGK